MSPTASFSFKGQATQHETVKWSHLRLLVYSAKPRNTRPLIFVPSNDKTCNWLMSLFQSLSLICMNWPSVALNYVVTASSIPNNRSTTDSPCNGNRLSKIKISNGSILLYFQSPEGANCTLCWKLRTTISNLVRDELLYSQ